MCTLSMKAKGFYSHEPTIIKTNYNYNNSKEMYNIEKRIKTSYMWEKLVSTTKSIKSFTTTTSWLKSNKNHQTYASSQRECKGQGQTDATNTITKPLF